MKRIIIGIVSVAILTAALTAVVIGLAFYQDYTTKKFVNGYYDGLIKGDYDAALSYVNVWSSDPAHSPKIDSAAVKSHFIDKISTLKSHNYQVTKVDKVIVIADGSKLGASVKLTVSYNGITKQVNERLHFYNKKIVIVESQDSLAHYRDGKLLPELLF